MIRAVNAREPVFRASDLLRKQRSTYHELPNNLPVAKDANAAVIVKSSRDALRVEVAGLLDRLCNLQGEHPARPTGS